MSKIFGSLIFYYYICTVKTQRSTYKIISFVLGLHVKLYYKMKTPINTLTLILDMSLANNEVTMLRGAVMKAMENTENTVLFHNHTDTEEFRQRYPLIQYKSLFGRAAIVGVQEGMDSLMQFANDMGDTLRIGEKERPLSISEVLRSETLICISDIETEYSLSRWLALNPENVQVFSKLERRNDRNGQCELLERILTGNILSTCKGLEIFFDQKINVHITYWEQLRSEYVKGAKMQVFDVKFKCNVVLPQYIGLGKLSSKGYGILTKITSLT